MESQRLWMLPDRMGVMCRGHLIMLTKVMMSGKKYVYGKMGAFCRSDSGNSH
jgi:hypothetical protein